MYRQFWIPIMLTAFALSPFALEEIQEPDSLSRLPAAVLLTGYPPFKLFVTSEKETWKLQEEGSSFYVHPSMSGDGRIIASARLGHDSSSREVLAVATYSMLNRKWTEHEQIVDFRRGIAISPDGSRLAFAVRDPVIKGIRLRIIDLKTGKMSSSPEIGKHDRIDLSWSPDGRSVVYDMNQSLLHESPRHGVFVLDLESGKISKIVEGRAPSWSPSGEWIAFLESSESPSQGQWIYAPGSDRLSVIRPDGTGSRVLVTLPKDRYFAASPVWSPDSSRILLNELWDSEKGTVRIHLLDVSTLKLTTTKFKDVPPVFGWAVAR